MSKNLKEYKRVHLERESELNELFDRTQWIFDDESEAEKKRNKPRIYMPDGMDVLKLSERLEIEVEWRKNVRKESYLPLLGFSLFWNLIVVVIAVSLIMSGSLPGLIFLGLHAFAGFGMMSNALSLIFNKTKISVTKNEISISHNPIFSLTKKNKTIKSTEIEQFYVRKKVSERINGVPTYQYDLDIRLKKGKTFKLLSGLSHESLLFLEQELENYLDIKDKKVRNEAAY